MRNFMRAALGLLAAAVCAAPLAAGASSWGYPHMNWCGSYYSYGSCGGYTYHNYSPYSYAGASAHANGGYAYASAGYSSYPMYSYPQTYNYPPINYSYNYGNYGNQYCYSGYGCYPMHVADPHQWVYDYWSGTWY